MGRARVQRLPVVVCDPPIAAALPQTPTPPAVRLRRTPAQFCSHSSLRHMHSCVIYHLLYNACPAAPCPAFPCCGSGVDPNAWPISSLPLRACRDPIGRALRWLAPV